MRALLLFGFISFAGCLIALENNSHSNALQLDSQVISISETNRGDTIIKHRVLQVDEHLVIQDSIFITAKAEKQKVITKVIRSYWIEISVISLIALSFINHYIKHKKNG